MPILDELNKRNLENFSLNKADYLLPSEDLLVDYSKYKPYLGESISLNVEQWDDERAKNQSSGEKFINSIGQGLGTFGTALASTVATLGGAAVGGIGQIGDAISGEDNTDFMDTMINNPIMQGINDFDKYLKEEVVPTYYTKEQQESLFSASLGTDFLNGLGFLASNVIPTAAVTKVFGSLSKMASAAKAGKLVKTLDAAVDAGKITNAEKTILSGVGKYFNQAPVMIGATVGRLGESSIEAYGTYEQIKESLTAESQEALQEIQLYGSTSKKVYSEEEIEAEAKRGRNNVFMGNMALAASDMLQFTRLFQGSGIGGQIVRDGLKSVPKNFTKTELLGKFLKKSGQEAAEEGFQFLLSKGAEKSAKGKSFLAGINEASGELFSTIEGQRSMLLGALLGGGMGAVGHLRSAKQQKQNLQQLADQLTSVGDTTERFITDPSTGKKIVNPALSKIATNFMFYEQQKEQAKLEGDQTKYDIAEKMQFSALVSAKMDAGQLEDFKNELEEMGKATTEEVESMLGELPIKNGVKMTPQQIVADKLNFIKRIEDLNTGLTKIPALSKLSNSGLKVVRHSLFTQEALRSELQDIDTQILGVKAKAVTSYFPDTQELFESELLPQDQMELELLESTREGVLTNFLESQEKFRDLIKNPETAEQISEDAKINAVDKAIKEHEEDVIKTEEIIKDKKTVVDNNGNEYTIEEEDTEGNVILKDVQGETHVMTKEDFKKTFANELIEDDFEDTNDVEIIPEAQRNENLEEDKDKKPTILSSSGQGIQLSGNFKMIEEGEYVLNPDFIAQTKKFNSPTTSNDIVTSPTDKPNLVQFKAEEGKIADLDETNARRKANGQEEITQKDLESDEFLPIKLTLVFNGVANNNITHFFHTPDYYYQTAEYEQIEKSKDISSEKKLELHKNNIERYKNIRSQLIKAIRAGSVLLNTTGKSKGALNYNPKVDGVKKVSPVLEIFDSNTLEEFINPKAHNLYVIVNGKPKQIKTQGLKIVKQIEELEEGGYLITTINSKFNETAFVSRHPYNLGEIIYDIVAPNGEVSSITPFNRQSFTPEQIDGLANLINHRLITGENEIEVDGKKAAIVGRESMSGLVDSLIYVGAVKSKSSEAISSQLVFAKDGTLILGKQKITKEDPDALSKITAHLNQFKSKPHFKMRSISMKEFGIPTQTENGWKVNKPISYLEYMFKGDNALIKTALNKTHFTNVYFGLALDNTGEKLLVPEEKSEVGSPTTQLNDIDAKKADIERRRKEELDINTKIIKFEQEFYDKKSKEQKEWIEKYGKNDDGIAQGIRMAVGSLVRAKEETNKINAKYDLELAALEQTETKENPNISNEVLENENECKAEGDDLGAWDLFDQL